MFDRRGALTGDKYLILIGGMRPSMYISWNVENVKIATQMDADNGKDTVLLAKLARG